MIYDACDNAVAAINRISISYTLICRPAGRYLHVTGTYRGKEGVVHKIDDYLGPPLRDMSHTRSEQ